MTFGNYSLHNSNKYLHPAFTSEKVEAGILTKPIETVQKTIETGVDTFVGQENDQKKKKTRTRIKNKLSLASKNSRRAYF